MKNNRGVVLAATLIILLVLAVLIAGVLALSISSTDMQSTRNESAQALYLAEAGMNRFIQEWRKDTTRQPPSITAEPLREGNFDVAPEASFNWPGPYHYKCRVISTGTVHPGKGRELKKKVSLIIEHTSQYGFGPVAESPNNELGGIVQAPDENAPVEVPNSDVMPRPDWDAYHKRVCDDSTNGHHLYQDQIHLPDPPNSTDITYSSKNTPFVFKAKGNLSGIYYVHGDIELDQLDLQGTLIATGKIYKKNGNPDISITPLKTDEGMVYFPALIAGGSIDFKGGQSEINGLIWAGGQINLKASAVVNGAVYSLTGIDLGNGTTTISYNMPGWPPDFGFGEDAVQIIRTTLGTWNEDPE